MRLILKVCAVTGTGNEGVVELFGCHVVILVMALDQRGFFVIAAARVPLVMHCAGKQ